MVGHCWGLSAHMAEKDIRTLVNVRLPWVLLGLMAWAGPWAPVLAPRVAQAQEQFTTQSGGRGVVNARTNARLSKTELELEAAKAELAKIKPHAKEEILTCIEDGNKLRWDGKAWTCSEEIDPTVQAWAKTALPTCTDGRTLSVIGGAFGCSTASFVTVENDPTVQAFAKEALPACGAGQVLSAGADGRLSCSNDEQGLTRELDPNVHDFARIEKAGVPNCSGSEVLTMTGARLSCKPDQLGLTMESDPLVQDFARKDIAGYSLTACATGELVKSVTQTGKVVLKCESASAAISETLLLNDLLDVNTAGQTISDTLVFDGTIWRPRAQLGSSGNPLFLSQLGDVAINTALTDEVLRFNGSAWVNSDDKLGTLTDTKWCRVVGSEIVCNIDAPPNCSATQLLSWDFTSNTWLCESVATKVGGVISLNDLSDVTITSVMSGQALRWNGTGWVNSMLERVLMDDSQVLVSDTGANGTITLATDGQSRMLVDQDGRVGIGVQPTAPYYLDVSGTTRLASGLVTADLLAVNGAFTGNLTVVGNLNVSGSQSLDGVLFANGGIQMPGLLSGGAVSTTNLSATVADVGTLRAQNVSVTQNLSVAGVLYAQGGLVLAGTFAPESISTSTISVSVIDVAEVLRVSGTTRVQDLVVNGNLQVSGSQTIDGVSFANGGVSATGTVTATAFAGSGAGLTNLPASGIVAAGSVGSVQFKGDSGEISGTSGFVFNAAAQVLTMPGMVSVTNVKLATTGAEVCDGNGLGTMRFNSVSGKLQICRP
jgi:cytoskeletal protein CcmA (bactofilin family)